VELTDQQRDALTEVLNIATARTAAALSDLSGQRVVLDVPELVVYPIGQLADELGVFIHDDIVTVHQIFSGPVSGDALLLLGYYEAVTLTDLMINENVHSKRLNASAREVLVEVGNILLNACMGIFGDLLQVRVSFAVPRLHLDDLAQLLRSLTIGQEELQYALVVLTTFRLRDSEVNGYLVIVLGVASLDHLLQAIEQLG
jgi:chemotaxis protein CheC